MPDKKAKNKNTDKKPEPDFYPDISNTASAAECTGMMHAPPQNEDELEALQELSNMAIPKETNDGQL